MTDDILFILKPDQLLLMSVERGARAMRKRSGSSESPWKIPLLMLIFLDVNVPFSFPGLLLKDAVLVNPRSDRCGM